MRAILFGTVLIVSLTTYSTAQIDEILEKAGDALSHQNAASLSDSKITAGLKQALEISTGKAVSLTGRPDGFFKNQAIKILLPPKLQTVAKGMRMFGMGAQVDELELGMNRAAEQAAPEAKRIFLSALKQMTFDDARRILQGSDTAATEYFKRTSTADLTTAFSPIVHRSMERVGVVQQYNQVIHSAPGGTALAGQFDLDKYVVGKTLDGLFYMLGQEEIQIRKNPAAQTTALLKEVFGAVAGKR
ncbi:MAG TPA: DUF4197 domain-containing protein [Terriglobales bacterium]|jgi:Protein of unknown function (DUF4197)|nr:DUF4197 domain-containing protein [Terriglobales bacterium]